jgi:carbon storage regulator
VLVLKRREGERLVINENIVVTILSIEGAKIKVGVEAPKEVRVVRGELLDVIQASKQRFEEKVSQ